MTAKGYLSQYRYLNDRINAKTAQVEELRRKAQSVGGGKSDGVHNPMPYDRIGETTIKIVTLENEINSDINRLVELQKEITDKINQLSDSRLKLLLELRYINCLTFERIAARMNYSYMQVCRLHGKALSAFSEKML